MSEKKRVLILVLIMAAACVAVAGTTIAILYRTSVEEQGEALVAIAQSRARFIEASAKFDAAFNRDYPGGWERATLNKIIEAHKQYNGIGKTGEFTLAKLEGNNIVFLLSHRHYDLEKPRTVPLDSNLAEPMRRALLGHSGKLVGLDYRGETVLAAYEPLAALNWGIVAKIDLAEIRAPFVKAGAAAIVIAVVVILFGASLFLWITNPIIQRLKEHSKRLTTLVESLQRIEGKLQESNEDLERRVEGRTAELVSANERLEIEVRERTQAEERLRALWKIAEMVDSEDRILYDHVLQGALRMTQSRYAFYGFMNPDESVMSIHSWSEEIFQDCRMREQPVEFPIAKAGIWADAVRRRQVLLLNDYEADHPGKLGLPEGHVPLTRILVVPVFSHGRIVSVVAAANKAVDYEEGDAHQLEAFVSGVQVIIDQRKTENRLRESEKECRLLSRQVIEAQENERKRFARDIHDGIGQSLAAIKYRIEGYSRFPKEEEPSKAQELNSIVRMIQESMEEVRRIQNDLRPAYLDELGIIASLTGFCEGFRETYSGIQIKAGTELSESDIPEYLKAPVFRIFQEAMNNAAKHSQAGQISVSLLKTEYGLELTVEDNGIGFLTDHGTSGNSHGRGLGLYSMGERAELSGGTLEIQSAPGKGTAIRVTWPFKDSKID